MGLFDRFRGSGSQRPSAPQQPSASADDQAIARYRYMLHTAPPETIERAHAEAFAQLTPEQRRRVLDQLARETPEPERAAVLRAGDSPEQLARVATRAEIRQPGAIERVFGGMGGGPGLGSLLAGTFFASMAGTVIGSMIGRHFFDSQPETSQLFGHRGDALSDDYGGIGGDIATDSDFDFGGGDTFDI
jgi:hypothetical protein